MLCGRGHQVEQRAPVHRAATRKMTRAGIEQAQFIGGNQNETGLIQAAPASSAEHLQNLVRLERLLDLVAAIGFTRQGHAAQGEIDSGRQTHRGDNHAELPGLGERLDHARAGAVAQSAVMIGDAASEQLRQVFADDHLLFSAQLERIGHGQMPRQFGGHGLGRLAARSKNQNRPQVVGERLGHQPRPIAANLAWQMIIQIIGVDLFERHRALVMANQHGFASEALQPFNHILRVADAAAEQKQLGSRRRQCDSEFVVQAAVRITEHLVFVHDKQSGPIASNEFVLLRLQRCYQDGSGEIVRKVAGGNANFPAPSTPFCQFVIGQRPRRHSVDRLAAIFALV